MNLKNIALINSPVKFRLPNKTPWMYFDENGILMSLDHKPIVTTIEMLVCDDWVLDCEHPSNRVTYKEGFTCNRCLQPVRAIKFESI